MKNILGFIILILIGTVLVAAATQRPNKKYRHVRTNKKAWARKDATSIDSLSIEEYAPEVWVSCDSILICTHVTYHDVEVDITDQLNDYAVINYYSFEQLTPEVDERIDISAWDDGIYLIRIHMKYHPEVCMYGYFAKGDQYEAEVETLNDEISAAVTPVVEDRTGSHDNAIYDLQGHRVAQQHMIEGQIYIQNGRKFRR